jgi:hypothetical protein
MKDGWEKSCFVICGIFRPPSHRHKPPATVCVLVGLILQWLGGLGEGLGLKLIVNRIRWVRLVGVTLFWAFFCNQSCDVVYCGYSLGSIVRPRQGKFHAFRVCTIGSWCCSPRDFGETFILNSNKSTNFYNNNKSFNSINSSINKYNIYYIIN